MLKGILMNRFISSLLLFITASTLVACPKAPKVNPLPRLAPYDDWKLVERSLAAMAERLSREKGDSAASLRLAMARARLDYFLILPLIEPKASREREDSVRNRALKALNAFTTHHNEQARASTIKSLANLLDVAAKGASSEILKIAKGSGMVSETARLYILTRCADRWSKLSKNKKWVQSDSGQRLVGLVSACPFACAGLQGDGAAPGSFQQALARCQAPSHSGGPATALAFKLFNRIGSELRALTAQGGGRKLIPHLLPRLKTAFSKVRIPLNLAEDKILPGAGEVLARARLLDLYRSTVPYLIFEKGRIRVGMRPVVGLIDGQAAMVHEKEGYGLPAKPVKSEKLELAAAMRRLYAAERRVRTRAAVDLDEEDVGRALTLFVERGTAFKTLLPLLKAAREGGYSRFHFAAWNQSLKRVEYVQVRFVLSIEGSRWPITMLTLTSQAKVRSAIQTMKELELFRIVLRVGPDIKVEQLFKIMSTRTRLDGRPVRFWMAPIKNRR